MTRTIAFLTLVAVVGLAVLNPAGVTAVLGWAVSAVSGVVAMGRGRG